LHMHPEAIACDVTFGTENTKKQLFTLATLDGNNKSFNCGRAYIPNGQAWVFWHCFKHCLKALWGDLVTSRVSLMCTDGCAQEYQSFIHNTGDGETFPNAVHTLCYYHTAILGFNSNVRFPPRDAPSETQRAIDVVRWFVRSWFFDLETAEEYKHSRSYLNTWLDRARGKVLDDTTVNSIKTWLEARLQPLQKMWLNHERLYVCTMNLRTTSICEAMHSSMKSGFDGVRAAMDTCLSADTMMDKAQRILHERQREVAKQQRRWKKFSSLPTAPHLTEFCQKEVDRQWGRRTLFVVVHAKVNMGEWWVFQPHQHTGGVSAPPAYSRLRRVKLVNGKYLWCSCGLPSRMKYPCAHVYAVTQEVSMCMFGVRWYSQFQHFYGRECQGHWTKAFDSMMAMEFDSMMSRNNKDGVEEVLDVDGMEFLSNPPVSWLSIEDDTNPMVIQAKHLHQLTWVEKRVAVKGTPLPGVHDIEEETHESTFELECHVPDIIKELQLSQQHAVTSHREKKNARKAQMLEKVRDALNLADEDPESFEIMAEIIDKMHSDITGRVASRKREERNKRRSEFAFPETGRSRRRVEKRKKNVGQF